MPLLNHAILWVIVGVLVATAIVRWVYLIKVEGKTLDLRLTLIRVLIILGVVLAVVMGIWTIPHR